MTPQQRLQAMRSNGGQVGDALATAGWTVMVVWEHEVASRKRLAATLHRLMGDLERARASG